MVLDLILSYLGAVVYRGVTVVEVEGVHITKIVATDHGRSGGVRQGCVLGSLV